MIKVDLPSGAKLEIDDEATPFEVSKAMLIVVFEEVGAVKMSTITELDVNFFKQLFCLGVSSKKLEASIYSCFERCTYNGLRIDPKVTFQPLKARGDYIQVCKEVAQANLLPFTKNLSALFADFVQQAMGSLPSS